MTRSATGGTLPDLARYRLANKPYTISEYHHPAPNEFRVEAVPLLAAFACVQDWDGFYLFDYHAEQGNWDANKIRGYFDVDSDAAIMAFLPAAALMFQRYDVPFAHRESRLHVARPDVPGLMAKNGPSIAAEWQDAGISGLDSLDTRLSVMVDPEKSGEKSRSAFCSRVKSDRANLSSPPDAKERPALDGSGNGSRPVLRNLALVESDRGLCGRADCAGRRVGRYRPRRAGATSPRLRSPPSTANQQSNPIPCSSRPCATWKIRTWAGTPRIPA